jgi:hypothetical protein
MLSLAGIAAAQCQPGTVLWSCDIGERIVTSPSVDKDGTVYVGSASALHAITNAVGSASNKWTFPVGVRADYSSSPAIGADGTIYFIAGQSNAVFALSPEGTQKWSFGTESAVGTPAIGLDNSIYVTAYSSLRALSAAGTPNWAGPVGAWSSANASSPALASDGSIFVVSREFHKTYALNRDGSVKWTASSAYGSVSVGKNGTVYSTGGQVTAIGPDGTNLWVFFGDLPLDGPAVISANGTIYVPATGSHTLYAISSTGQLLWTLAEPTGRGVPATAVAIDAGGVIYYCASNSVLALDEQAAVKWSVFGGFDPGYFTLSVTSPTISPDGVLYAALGSRVYAIDTGTNGPANSPWPM